MFKNYIPFLSDIDITHLYSTPHQLARFHFIYSIFKKVFPPFGEVNHINTNNFHFLIHFANHYELQRDPYLLSKIGTLPKISSIESNVFLLKLLWNDRSNYNNFDIRISKWRNHLKSVDLSASKKETPYSIIEKAIPDLSLYNFKAFLDAIMVDYKPHDLLRTYARELLLINPIEFMSIHINLRTTSYEISNLNDFEIALIVYHIKWEIWGLYTQLPYLEQDNLFSHLSNIQTFLLQLNIESSEIVKGIDYIRECWKL